MDDKRKTVSYCIGLATGKDLRQQFSDVEHDELIEGFTTALMGEEPKISDAEIDTTMNMLRQQIEKQQKEFIARVSEENKQMGQEFLEKNKEKEGVIALPSGLQYRVINSGEGRSPTPVDTVEVNYQGKFLDGQIFEDSFKNEKPQRVQVNRVINGWSEALKMMKEGDRWEVFIPHYLAYGEAGYGQHIGPNSTLIFEIELLKVVS